MPCSPSTVTLRLSDGWETACPSIARAARGGSRSRRRTTRPAATAWSRSWSVARAGSSDSAASSIQAARSMRRSSTPFTATGGARFRHRGGLGAPGLRRVAFGLEAGHCHSGPREHGLPQSASQGRDVARGVAPQRRRYAHAAVRLGARRKGRVTLQGTAHTSRPAVTVPAPSPRCAPRRRRGPPNRPRADRTARRRSPSRAPASASALRGA